MNTSLSYFVDELLTKKIVCVPMSLVCAFVIECHNVAIECMGGAFTDDMNYQYFYI